MNWPDKPFHIVLVEPKIPPNTGNIARLCAATQSVLHLIEPIGFRLDDAAVKRAGLDYWDAVSIHTHESLTAFFGSLAEGNGASCYFFSTKAEAPYTAIDFATGDILIFGSETQGLSDRVRSANERALFRIPIHTDNVRSLNLANSVAIVLYEGLRQISSS